MSEHNPINCEWNDSLTGDYLWSNVNFGEAVTEPMTPLAWKVLQFTLDDWVFLPGFSTIGNIGGRPYLNISVFASLFNALGKNRQDLLNMMEGTLYMRLPEEMEIPLVPMSRWALIISLPNLVQLQFKQMQGVRFLPAYLAKNPAWFRRTRERIQSEKSRPALLALWQEEIKPHVKRGVWIVLGIVNHSTTYAVRLRRELTALVGSKDAQVLIANLSDDVNLLPSLGPVVGLAQVARGELERAVYLEQCGHRGPHEFEISVPRPAEDPVWLDQQIAQFLESPVDVQALLSKQQDRFDAAWKRFLVRFPRKAKGMRHRIAESARRARLREEARSEYIRDRWLIRLFAIRAGELTNLGDDVFFLTLDELLAVLRGEETAVSYIPDRREKYKRYKSLPPYPSLIRGHFHPFQWAADPLRRSDFFDELVSRTAGLSAASNSTITGSPGAAGCVTGFVRRLQRPEDAPELKIGEILVTGQTDIAWTTLFPRAAAIITDVGAPLSHAAIVARELGIPAVVGCGDATMRLKTGDRVHVDGGQGIVKIIKEFSD